MMQPVQTHNFLRRVFFFDAATSFMMGLLMTLGANMLAPLLGLPVEFIRWIGLLLLPFAAFLVYLATREKISPLLVEAVIVSNALWVVGSLLFLVGGWFALTAIGAAFICVQAIGVLLFAGLEAVGLRKAMVPAV